MVRSMRWLEQKSIVNWYKRKAGLLSFQHQVRIRLDVPIISFTFDDFPYTALATGGEILRGFDAAGTYYVSLGLLGKESPSGTLCSAEDVVQASKDGHEIGCHTYSHCHSWDTESAVYEKSIQQNRAALATLLPGASFESFSYPISLPRPALKRICTKYFAACRAGGQKLNAGVADLNQLSAYFLEKAGSNFDLIEQIIDENARKCGWLIFATHDVSAKPGPYGCTTDFFSKAVRCSVKSGARILPIIQAVRAIQSHAAAA